MKHSFALTAAFTLVALLNGCTSTGRVQPDPATSSLTRVVTAPLGAEFTGMFLNDDGSLFLNVQHPSGGNRALDGLGRRFDRGTIGVIVGNDFNHLGGPQELAVPATRNEQEVLRTSLGQYQVLAQQGDPLADGRSLGDLLSADGGRLLDTSRNPDFNAAVADGEGGYYLYTSWEDRPGAMSRLHLARLGSDGYARVVAEGMLDFSPVRGTWVNCFGSLSPWGTPLASEELYFDDTANWFDPDYRFFIAAEIMAEYLGYPSDRSGPWPNPYDYGYIVEVGVNGSVASEAPGAVQVEKREALGRFSHENSIVLPDQRTVLLSDDGTGTVLFKFVADRAGDLTSGRLYAARVSQAEGVTDPRQAVLGIRWIELAHGSEDWIEAAIRSFDGRLADARYIRDQQIRDWAEARLQQDLNGDGRVAANPFEDDRPAFLESRKAAAALGASAEFRKMEGVVLNRRLADEWWNGGAADGKPAYLYLAMSSFDKTMSDGKGDIRLDGRDGKCGVVYRMKLIRNKAGLADVEALVPAVVGGPHEAMAQSSRCSVDSIANPDNLVVLPDGRLLIGEDSGQHENNMVWLFEDPATR